MQPPLASVSWPPVHIDFLVSRWEPSGRCNLETWGSETRCGGRVWPWVGLTQDAVVQSHSCKLTPSQPRGVVVSSASGAFINPQPPARFSQHIRTQLPSNAHVPWSVASLQGLPGLPVSVAGNPGVSSCSNRDPGYLGGWAWAAGFATFVSHRPASRRPPCWSLMAIAPASSVRVRVA